MIAQKSPGGSIFPYYYKNGELFGLHFGSFFGNEDALLARMQAEEAFMAGRNHPLPLWIDFYETKLSDRVLAEFSAFVARLSPLIPRLAIAGCSTRDQRRLLRQAKKSGRAFAMPVKFFDDPEVAKTWLVGESS